MDIPNPMAGFDPSMIIDKIYFFTGIALLMVAMGGLFFGMWYIKSKDKKDRDSSKVTWWVEVTGKKIMEPSRTDIVQEVILPGTILRLFYCKKRDLWLPRFSRGINKDLFFVGLTPTQQMINFTIKGISEDLKKADLEYDHTDMIWAAENTREFVKRNYKDKSVKWWQMYQGVITTAAYILIMTFSLVIIIYFMRGIVEDMGSLLGAIENVLDNSCARTVTSGVTAA